MLDLTVPVPADEWAYCQRRIAYLQAAVVALAREEERVLEWYDAATLELMALPGLPSTKAGITRKAATSHWQRRLAPDGPGRRYEYHVTSLPGRAFDALLSLLLDLPEPEWTVRAPSQPVRPTPENMAPPWVLPLMRLMKGSAEGNLAQAWARLPAALPEGTPVPTVEEAARVLVNLGVVRV